MIGKLEGKIIYKSAKEFILDVSGVGYSISATDEDISKITEGKNYSVWTHLVVRENALDLYGFFEIGTKSFFKLLIGVSGIGPKTAIGILNIAPPKILKQAIATQNTSYLTKVSGIGKKSAGKIVLELRDKLAQIDTENIKFLEEDQDTILALKSLGYSITDARDALQSVPDTITGTQERIREALKILSK